MSPIPTERDMLYPSRPYPRADAHSRIRGSRDARLHGCRGAARVRPGGGAGRRRGADRAGRVPDPAGGNSAIGAQQVAKSAPDGYTLLVAMDVTLVMNPITSTSLPYDARKDF